MAAKRKSALALAASKRLQSIGSPAPQMNAEQMAHALLHAEERGEVERVSLDDGTWGWRLQGPGGKMQIVKPTPDMLAALERFETEGHPTHD